MFIPNPAAMRRALKFTVSGSRGGPARLKILLLLAEKPANTNEISKSLSVDYKTAQHHMRVLEKSGFVKSPRRGYGNSYSLSQIFDKALIAELKDMGESR